jgi:hypothetical protein
MYRKHTWMLVFNLFVYHQDKEFYFHWIKFYVCFIKMMEKIDEESITTQKTRSGSNIVYWFIACFLPWRVEVLSPLRRSMFLCSCNWVTQSEFMYIPPPTSSIQMIEIVGYNWLTVFRISSCFLEFWELNH